MKCQSCGADTPEQSKFCTACGEAVRVVCPACQHPNPPGARFCAECGSKLVSKVEEAAQPLAASMRAAERRQLTVMFCDLVGSTELSARLDAEDLREIITRYQACVTETLNRFDGFVAKYMGDGVLAYFGYPHAHEDDAEQAVRAGLALVDAVGEVQKARRLQVRIGIATGLVVVGDLIGAGSAQEQAIVGETPNLAARLQALAEANSIAIAESTRRQIGARFEVDDLGPQSLKGFAEPQRAWCVLSENRALGRFEALRSRATPLVGRDEEMELLLRRWAQAKDGHGRVVLVSGEPGVGKSRIAEALLERISREPHIRLRYFCSPHHQDSALYPVIAQQERAAGFVHEDSPEQRLDKLRAVLAAAASPIEDVALIAELHALPVGDLARPLDVTPEKKKEKTFEALLQQVHGLSQQQQPLLMVFEDIHWIDPSSHELLDQTVERIANWRVLLLATFRPEFEPPWTGQSHVAMLTLTRLDRHDTAEMVTDIAGNRLSADIVQEIAERTDGVPLFVEELTKAVLESGAQAALSSVPHPALSVPATLHASLMARLDRLGPAAKNVAQMGAAIGRSFEFELLASIADLPEPRLQEALELLVNSGLLFARGRPPRATFRFKHALVQDAAYGTLLRSRRQEPHARIAEGIERQFSEVFDRRPELLAHHCYEAGLLEKAARLWGKAGQQSVERSALVEAVEQLTRALDLIASLPATAALRREQIKLQVALITPLIHVKGYAAPEQKAAAERARLLIEQAEALGESLEDPLWLFSALYGVWVASYVGFNGDEMRELAAQFLSLAEQQTAAGPLMVGHRLMGISLLCTGEIAQGRVHLDRVIALYDPGKHRSLATRFGIDTAVSVLSYRPMALWLLGYPKAALADSERALRDAREINHAPTLMYALTMTSLTHICCGNYKEAKAQLDGVASLANEKGATFWKAYGTLVQGWLFTLTGKTSNAVQQITFGITAWRSTGATLWTPWYLSYLARAFADLDQFDDAWRCIDEALTVMQITKERWCEAEVHRTAGEIALISPQPDWAKAEENFDSALAVARAQQAKSWELRTAMSYARLMLEQGRAREAYELLAPIYGWFTEGFGTKDLKDAKALL